MGYFVVTLCSSCCEQQYVALLVTKNNIWHRACIGTLHGTDSACIIISPCQVPHRRIKIINNERRAERMPQSEKQLNAQITVVTKKLCRRRARDSILRDAYVPTYIEGTCLITEGSLRVSHAAFTSTRQAPAEVIVHK